MERTDNKYGEIRYEIFDPTGNITALVETAVDPADQPAVASGIMDLHPDVEQVGFVTFYNEGQPGLALGAEPAELDTDGRPANSDAGAKPAEPDTDGRPANSDAGAEPAELDTDGRPANSDAGAKPAEPDTDGRPANSDAGAKPAEPDTDGRSANSDAGAEPAEPGTEGRPAAVAASLRMAGGEFCGNATMCAAALWMTRAGLMGEAEARVRVSGATEPLMVSLARTSAVSFAAAVEMPPALGIDHLKLSDGMLPGSAVLGLPVVKLEGISHIIIEPDSGFFGLKQDRALAETLLRGWCGALGSECLGMMFLDEGSGSRPLTPLVYVPGADTMFWENSCASGSAAAGIWLAEKTGAPVDITFDEPAGQLRVESDPESGRTVLHGSVLFTSG
ncbi:MAG: hypothetical protein E7230_05290 [Clostridiales bacterium]|nr:hypothetical protein [Clostridiales bacterium]